MSNTLANVDPRVVKAQYVKETQARYAGLKWYRPVVVFKLRRTFRRASEALAYAEKVRLRWISLRKAASKVQADVESQHG